MIRVRRKKNLDKLLPKDSRKKPSRGSDRATAELIDRLVVIEDIANRFFDSVERQLEALVNRIDNLEEDFEQVIDAVAQFGRGKTGKIPSKKPRKTQTPTKPSTLRAPTTPSKPSPPSAPTPTPSVAKPGSGSPPSPPKIGGVPKVETKSGPNAPKF